MSCDPRSFCLMHGLMHLQLLQRALQLSHQLLTQVLILQLQAEGAGTSFIHSEVSTWQCAVAAALLLLDTNMRTAPS